ncbi:MAG: hypothetical protein NTW45_03965 [Rhodocyclales bacterium]|nr:hypothetical protein [Rhodocyclales bacterium]
MSRPNLPPGPEVPQSTVSALHALYHEAAGAEPGPMLDRSILDAARAELRVDRATQSRRPIPWWKGWLPVTSVIALAVVGLSVTWRVMDEQERHLREEMSAAQTAGETAGRATPAERPAEAKPSLDAPAPAAEKSRRVESTAARDAPVGVPMPAAMPAPAAPATMAPALVEEAVKKSQRAEKDEPRERRDTGAAAESASSSARALGKLEAQRLGTSASGGTTADSLAKPSTNSSAKSVAAPIADPATPEAWLQHIRELRAAGRSAEAAQSLARFRARYPDFVLPDDLLNLK